MDVGWQAELDLLRDDNRSGAQEVASRALSLLIDIVADSQPGSAASYRRWLLRAGRELVGVQPAMGILFRMVNDMLWACHHATGGEQIRQEALTFLQGYQSSAGPRQMALDDVACDYLARYDSLMTYSRSSSVVRALTTMARKKAHIQVFCGEGRPMFEGQTLALELAGAGHRVTIGIDMALFGWLEQAQALVVGADSVSRDGIANKNGTFALMQAAREKDVPRIIVCTTAKLLPRNCLNWQAIGGGDPEEIIPASEERITVRNDCFDVTPLNLASVLLTDKGPLWGNSLAAELDALRAYPGLRSG